MDWILLINCVNIIIGLLYCFGFVVWLFMFLIWNLKWFIVDVIVFVLIVNVFIECDGLLWKFNIVCIFFNVCVLIILKVLCFSFFVGWKMNLICLVRVFLIFFNFIVVVKILVMWILWLYVCIIFLFLDLKFCLISFWIGKVLMLVWIVI